MRRDTGYACDGDDIDQMMADEIDAKGDELWEQGVREKLGVEEFERLYPIRRVRS